MISISAKSVGFYVGNKDKRVQELLTGLTETWGSRLEGMDDKWKLVFRGALACYQAIYQDWIEEGSSVSCIDSCIVGAGGDDFNIWDEQPDLVEYIQAIADDFSESDIEGLIEALTVQIRG